jgi:hypothetical protein
MSSLLLDPRLEGVPRPIVEKLRAVIRRARMVALLRGLIAVALVALVALLVGMAFDATITIFSYWGRAALSFTLLGATLIAAVVFLILPLRRTYSLAGIARIIEERHPELEERLSSSVELLSSRDAWELRGSEVLIAELAKQAVGQVGEVSPQKEFSLTVVARFAALLGAALLIFAVVFAIWPSTAALLVTRVVAPFANVGNVQAEDMQVKPGDIVIARGDSLHVEALVPHTRVRSARFFRTGADGRETSESMRSLSADENGYPRFFLGVAAVEESFRYRLNSGGALTQYYDVTVTPRPEVESFRIEYRYPEYASIPPRTTDAATGDIEALVGTEVTLTAKLNKAIKSAGLTVTGRESLPGTIAEGSEGVSVVTWKIALTDEYLLGDVYTLQLRDEHSFANLPVDYRIRSLADQAPKIAISEPAEEALRMKPYDTLPLAYRAEDDYGIGRVDMIAAIDGEEFAPRAIAVSTQASERVVEGTSRLRLSEIVEPGDRIVTVELRVVDNLPQPKGPQESVSRRITITLDEAAETYFEKQIAADYASIRDALQRALEDLKSADQRTTGLDQVANVDGSLPEPTLVRIDEARERVASAETTLLDLSGTMLETAYAALEYEVANLAETDVRMAGETAGLVKLSDMAAERTDRARESDAHVDKAIERTEALLAALDQAYENLKEIAEIEELAAQEAALAEDIAAAPLDQPLPQPLAEMQEDLAAHIAEAVKELPLAAIQALQEQKEEAEDLAAAAERLAEAQETLQDLTEMANAKEPKLDELVAKMKEALLAEQQQIAVDAGAFDEDVEEANLAGEDDASDLGEEAAGVAEALNQDDIPAAAEAAAAAAERFAEAASALAMNKPVPDAPAQGEKAAGEDPAGGDQPAGMDPAGADGGMPEPGDAPEAGAPEGAMPEAGAPEGGKPEAGKPEAGKPEAGAPEAGMPEAGMPEAGMPEAGMPEAGMPEAGMPEAGMPEGGMPEGGMPEGGMPEGGMPEGGMPEGGMPEGGEPEAGAPEGGVPEAGDAEGVGMPEAAGDEGMPAFGEAFELAQEASGLAARQRSVAERLEALAEGKLDQALAQGQADVAAESERLQMTAQAVEEALNLLGQPNGALQAAGKAAEELAQAADESGQAAENLGEIAPPDAGAGEEGMLAGAEPPAGAEGSTPAAGAPENADAAEGMPAGQGAPAAADQVAAGEDQAPAGAEGAAPAMGEPQVAGTDEAQALRGEAIGAQGQAAESFKAAAEAFKQLGEQIQIPDAPAPSDSLASVPGSEAMAAGLSEALGSAAEAMAALEAAEAGAQANASPADAASAAAAQAAAAAAAQRTADALAAAAAQAAAAGRPAPSQTASSQRGLPQRGRSPAQGPPTPSSQAAPGTGELGILGGTTDGELKEKLDEYGISVADWTRLPGELKNRIRQAEAEDAPEEYREMVRSYFREIARRSGRAPGAK